MTKKYIQPGNVIDFVAGAALASGKMVPIGARVGILLNDLASGETGAAQVEGVFEYAKKSADTFAQGALVYYDNANNELTSTASGNTLAGFAWVAAGSGVTLMQVKLNS